MEMWGGIVVKVRGNEGRGSSRNKERGSSGSEKWEEIR